MVRCSDRLDMAIAVDWDIKPQTNNIMLFVLFRLDQSLTLVLPVTTCVVLIHVGVTFSG